MSQNYYRLPAFWKVPRSVTHCTEEVECGEPWEEKEGEHVDQSSPARLGGPPHCVAVDCRQRHPLDNPCQISRNFHFTLKSIVKFFRHFDGGRSNGTNKTFTGVLCLARQPNRICVENWHIRLDLPIATTGPQWHTLEHTPLHILFSNPPADLNLSKPGWRLERKR